MQPNDKIKQQNATIANLVLEVAAERQRADMLLEQGKHAAAAVQAEQQRYEKLAQELAAAKAAQPVQQPAPVAADLAAFNAYFCNTLSCDGVETEQQVEDCRVAAYDAWCEATRRADARAALAAPVAAPVAMPAASVQPEFHVTETHGTAIVDTVRGQATILGKEVREYTIPAASVQPDERKFTQDDMERFAKECMAARDARIAATVQPDIGRDAALWDANAEGHMTGLRVGLLEGAGIIREVYVNHIFHTGAKGFEDRCKNAEQVLLEKADAAHESTDHPATQAAPEVASVKHQGEKP